VRVPTCLQRARTTVSGRREFEETMSAARAEEGVGAGWGLTRRWSGRPGCRSASRPRGSARAPPWTRTCARHPPNRQRAPSAGGGERTPHLALATLRAGGAPLPSAAHAASVPPSGRGASTVGGRPGCARLLCTARAIVRRARRGPLLAWNQSHASGRAWIKIMGWGGEGGSKGSLDGGRWLLAGQARLGRR
jgi:hypothetical protein